MTNFETPSRNVQRTKQFRSLNSRASHLPKSFRFKQFLTGTHQINGTHQVRKKSVRETTVVSYMVSRPE
jgi:hypothetical protein